MSWTTGTVRFSAMTACVIMASERDRLSAALIPCDRSIWSFVGHVRPEPAHHQ
jgi:hypothetical protein